MEEYTLTLEPSGTREKKKKRRNGNKTEQKLSKINLHEKRTLRSFDDFLNPTHRSRSTNPNPNRFKVLTNYAFAPIGTPVAEAPTKRSLLTDLIVGIAGDFLNEGHFDIPTEVLVDLGQFLTFGLYFHKTLTAIAKELWNSKAFQPVKLELRDSLQEMPSQLALGTCVMTISDLLDGTVNDMGVSVALLSAVMLKKRFGGHCLKSAGKVTETNCTVAKKD